MAACTFLLHVESASSRQVSTNTVIAASQILQFCSQNHNPFSCKALGVMLRFKGVAQIDFAVKMFDLAQAMLAL